MLLGDTPSETGQKISDQIDSGKSFFGGKTSSDERENDFIIKAGEQTSFFCNDKSDFSMVEAIQEAN